MTTLFCILGAWLAMAMISWLLAVVQDAATAKQAKEMEEKYGAEDRRAGRLGRDKLGIPPYDPNYHYGVPHPDDERWAKAIKGKT